MAVRKKYVGTSNTNGTFQDRTKHLEQILVVRKIIINDSFLIAPSYSRLLHGVHIQHSSVTPVMLWTIAKFISTMSVSFLLHISYQFHIVAR